MMASLSPSPAGRSRFWGFSFRVVWHQQAVTAPSVGGNVKDLHRSRISWTIA